MAEEQAEMETQEVEDQQPQNETQQETEPQTNTEEPTTGNLDEENVNDNNANNEQTEEVQSEKVDEVEQTADTGEETAADAATAEEGDGQRQEQEEQADEEAGGAGSDGEAEAVKDEEDAEGTTRKDMNESEMAENSEDQQDRDGEDVDQQEDVPQNEKEDGRETGDAKENEGGVNINDNNANQEDGEAAAGEVVESGATANVRGAGESEEVTSAQHQYEELEDKKTPEPPTEHAGTGTEKVDNPQDEAQMTSPPPAQVQTVEAHAPSPVPYDKDATATVKFVLLPTQQVATLRCYLTQTLAELKEHFAQELKIPHNAILLLMDGRGTEDGMTLGDLGVGPNGTIRLEMQSADPINTPIRAFKPRQEYTMPDVITVRVQSGEGAYKDIVVEIERATRKKPFLGGYRHKNTQVEFHHASAQTQQKQRQVSGVEKYCRDTQTVQERHETQQTTNDMSTQMTKIGVYVTNMSDKLVTPGQYTTADDFKSNVLDKVVILQKYYRRWLAKRYVTKVRDDQDQRVEWEREEEIRKKKEKEDRIRIEFERRMNPKTKEDFDLLFHALEKWRKEEEAHINDNLTGAERKAALCQLLDQETQLITSIGRHKIEADGENHKNIVQEFLNKAASAKKWRGPDGKTTEMDTPYTIRAQELRDIYNSINMKYLTQDERLDVLLTLKHTVKEHDCKLTQEIIELIDREADLLMRGVKESNLEGLRRRIATLFLQYIKTPTFNPEAARLLKVPQDPAKLRKNIYFCPSCSQYLPSTEFQLTSNSRSVGKCRKCNKMDNDARIRQDYSHYRFMIKSMRRSEDAYGDGSKIAFLMQENDLRHLVENVWNSQSVLSAWEDLYDLVLVRWDRHEQWSPWNCILLTKEEATAHDKLEDLEEAYGKVFIHKVKHKHTLARNYFSRLPGMAEQMRATRSAGSAISNGPSVAGKAVPVASAKA